jgi:hypothetical protein
MNDVYPEKIDDLVGRRLRAAFRNPETAMTMTVDGRVTRAVLEPGPSGEEVITLGFTRERASLDGEPDASPPMIERDGRTYVLEELAVPIPVEALLTAERGPDGGMTIQVMPGVLTVQLSPPDGTEESGA